MPFYFTPFHLCFIHVLESSKGQSPHQQNLSPNENTAPETPPQLSRL